jgi:hypothetical protein
MLYRGAAQCTAQTLLSTIQISTFTRKFFFTFLLHQKLSLFGWLVADGWCWFVLREEHCWLVAAGCWWLIRSERKVLLTGG